MLNVKSTCCACIILKKKERKTYYCVIKLLGNFPYFYLLTQTQSKGRMYNVFHSSEKMLYFCSRYKIHTTVTCNEIRKLARLRVVDNSEIGKRAMAEGKPPKCIHVYNKQHVGYIGDKVLVAIKGQMKKGILVGLKQKQNPKVPRFDSNNVVLIDDNGSPLGTRIHMPIPTILRTVLKERTVVKGADYTKVLAIASRFV